MSKLSGRSIEVVGARTHNLKGVSCTIPHGALTVITGVSGSGKSSLAFDTLYADGQRRYVDAMSTYARQFLERMQRPDADSLTGIPPGIAIEQRNGVRNARSTVGTTTEVSDYLRLLYARVGRVHCPGCGLRIEPGTAQDASDQLWSEAQGRRVQIAAPLAPVAAREVAARKQALLMAGHRRLLEGDTVLDLEEVPARRLGAMDPWRVLIDRLVVRDGERTRLTDALRDAFRLGAGRADVVVEGEDAARRLSEGYVCIPCDETLRIPEPAGFSYNSPLGACPDCQGFGRVVGIDWDKVVPDARKSIKAGAIAPFQMPSSAECQDDLEKTCRKNGIRLDVPWSRLAARDRKLVLDGDPQYRSGGWRRGQWYGVRGFFRYLESKKYKMHVRVLLSRFRGYDTCPRCEGTRLRPEVRGVRIGERSIAEVEAMQIAELRPFFAEARRGWSAQEGATAGPVLQQLESRVAYLEEVGLGYLTLIRQTRTLSGGEYQRIALASALGAQLTGTMYVLDEPSVGLHPRDTGRLVSVLRRLADRGNTVIVVEHEPEVMKAADHVVDLGPQAGARGGELVFEGTFDELMRSATSKTGEFLRSRREALVEGGASAPRAAEVEPRYGGPIGIRGARAHNLKGLDVDFPVHAFSVVTGVSGSGKSTLVEDVLHANALRQRGRPVDFVGPCDEIVGLDRFADVVLVDQSPLSRSSRSNPATYLKAMDELRRLFAGTPEAVELGLTAASFSFNVAKDKGGGRCEECQGQGTVTLEMHFLADVTVVCDACGGRRFSERVLRARLGGMTIKDCLDLTVDEALARFRDEPRIEARLRPFADVGLGYLTLGQSTATLSGGEAQRLKLAAHLAHDAGPTLFLFDEPTTGLHGRDVEVLLAALFRMVAAGHTVIAIEHNLDFIRHADFIVDLGPGGGPDGGRVVASGTPLEVARSRVSLTGQALREAFGLRASASRRGQRSEPTRRGGTAGRAAGPRALRGTTTRTSPCP